MTSIQTSFGYKGIAGNPVIPRTDNEISKKREILRETQIYASGNNGISTPAFCGLFSKKAKSVETTPKINLEPATPGQKDKITDRIRNLEGLSKAQKGALYDKLASLPAQCLANFVVSDNSGNPYIPDSMLVKLANNNYTIEPDYYDEQTGLQGNKTVIKKDGKTIGGIYCQLSYVDSGDINNYNDMSNTVRLMYITLGNTTLKINDRFEGKTQEPEATYSYKVDGVIDMTKSGKLSEIQ